jgi:hypothetical protein
MLARVTFRKALFVAFVFLVFFSTRTELFLAQSSDQGLPTPVLSNEINGTIRALDIGDPRLTRHFYAFEATPGDLIISLDSRNLNGDLDLFTAVTFKPLMKISMYAEVATPKVTKSIYLRSRQILILRVEARSPNDESGSYHISFGGSFRPFSGGIPVAENTGTGTGNESESARQSNVSSVGARIERPSEPANEAKSAEQPTEETAKAPSPTPTPRSARSSRTPRRRATGSARNRPARPITPPAKTETAKTEQPPAETKASQPAEKPEEKPGTKPEEKAAAAGKPEPEKPAAQPSGPHLIIERTDGNKLDRPMSTVRRVVIENGVIVVTLKNGRVERIPLAVIVKMAIEP